ITLTRCGISPPQREDEACHLHVTLYRTTIETISKSCGQHRHHHEKYRGEQRQCERLAFSRLSASFANASTSAVFLSGIGRRLDRVEYRGVIVLRLVDAGRDRPHPH